MSSIHEQCPWCGAVRIEAIAYLNNYHFKMWRARCTNCGASGPSHHTAEVALTRWDELKKPPEDKPKPKVPVEVQVRTVTVDRCKELAALSRRLTEMIQCMCADDLKCISCRIREILVEQKP